MSAEHYERIKQHPQFKQLTRLRARWGWGLACVILLMYFSFIMLIAFTPELLGKPIMAGSVITVGIPIGVIIILLAFVLTGIYVHKANTTFDLLQQQILDETRL